MTSMPCGPPNPRNAVCEVLCVRHTRPVTSTAGSLYALSTWNIDRHMMGSDKSRLQPPSEKSSMRTAFKRPSDVSPASYRARYGRSEEHTSELQSQSNLVCRLLLEKKKKKTNTKN